MGYRKKGEPAPHVTALGLDPARHMKTPPGAEKEPVEPARMETMRDRLGGLITNRGPIAVITRKEAGNAPYAMAYVRKMTKILRTGRGMMRRPRG